MTSDNIQCPICQTSNSQKEIFDHAKQEYAFECPTCGIYRMTFEAKEDAESFLNRITHEDRLYFSGYLRNFSSKDAPILINRSMLTQIGEIIAPYKRLTVPEKINNLIKFIYGNAKKANEQIIIQLNEVYRFYIQTQDDYYMLVNYLDAKNYIKNPDHTGERSKFKLTVEGWEKYESLKEININSKIAFVAMSFDPKLKYIFDKAIYPACKECRFSGERVDSREHNEKICDRIIAKINESRFVIADFTQNKHGVYFEAGYAMGLGIPIIWTCSREFLNKEDLHFDTRQYNHIIWENEKDLKERLISKIKATIGTKSNL